MKGKIREPSLTRPLPVALAVLLLCAGCGPAPGPRRLLIEGVTLIDGTGALPRTSMTLVIQGRKLEAILPADSVDPTRRDSVVDGSGLWAIPGLFDAHVHLSKAGPEALPALVALGVTTVRDMGGDLDQVRAMQRSIAAGEVIGPRIITPGPMLEAPATIERMKRSATAEPYERTRIRTPFEPGRSSIQWRGSASTSSRSVSTRAKRRIGPWSRPPRRPACPWPATPRIRWTPSRPRSSGW